VDPTKAASVYLHFLMCAVTVREVWSLQCHGELVLVTGEHFGCFPLWPDEESARYFRRRIWPDLEPAALSLARLEEHLRLLEAAGVPVGVGLAPHPEGVIVSAAKLRSDLRTAHKELREQRERSTTRPVRPL
jgi:hypothetical protein